MGGVGEEGLLLVECGQGGSGGPAGEEMTDDGGHQHQHRAAGCQEEGQLAVGCLVLGGVGGRHDRAGVGVAVRPGEAYGEEPERVAVLGAGVPPGVALLA